MAKGNGKNDEFTLCCSASADLSDLGVHTDYLPFDLVNPVRPSPLLSLHNHLNPFKIKPLRATTPILT